MAVKQIMKVEDMGPDRLAGWIALNQHFPDEAAVKRAIREHYVIKWGRRGQLHRVTDKMVNANFRLTIQETWAYLLPSQMKVAFEELEP